MDVLPLLDPEIADLLAAMPPSSPLSNDILPAVRAMSRRMAESYQPTGEVARTDHTLTSPDGHQFTVRVHRPIGIEGPLPAIVWMHGGGLISGSHLIDDGRFDRWSPRFGGVIGIAVDYGLAPERPYPGPLEDCYTALAWVHQNVRDLGVAPGRIGIGGASAGGNQAAGLALLARDRGEYDVEFQALIYPMLDDRMITPSSAWADAPIWPPASNDFGWSAYLEGRRGADDISPYAAPSRATDLSGLPPAFIAVGALDGFVDEDIDYASRLIQAGVATELHVYPGAPHGFDLMMVNTNVARRCRRHLDEWLEAQLTR